MNKHVFTPKNLLNASKRKAAVLSTICLLGIGGIGGSIAYLKLDTGKVHNTFTAGTVVSKIEEDFQDLVKKDVRVTNLGSVPVYIRAQLQFNWISENADQDGNSEMLPFKPDEGTDYTVVPGSSKWEKGSDGYYYYKEKVPAGETTENLVSSITFKKDMAPDGYVLNVDVLSQNIQAYPSDAVKETWGFIPDATTNQEVTG